MRLTLRTLLAYLDDTLEAAEIKEIGEKVAESDAAQELVARLKQVTRRRRLTAPSGSEGADANDVAEYLDNELPADRVSELEKQALESDVHLAEIAACHQILTLVLGEPALVPPKAKERMYGLVQGREAIPYRKAQPARKPDAEITEDEEELALASGWLRWVLPAAGALLVLLLALAVYQVLPGPRGKDNRVAKNLEKGGGEEDGGKPDAAPSEKDKAGTEKEKEKEPEKPPVLPEKDGAKDKEKERATQPEKSKPIIVGGIGEKPPVVPVAVSRAEPPSKDAVAGGTYAGGLSDQPSALVGRIDGEAWTRLSPGNTVQTNQTLMALPGFASVVQTRGGVGLLLRGHVREFTVAPIMDYLMDSAVVLHANSKFDLDLTLLRGRIYLTNSKEKGPVKIRLRFESEVWDVTLSTPGDEVGVDLLKSYSPLINYRKGEAPRADCYLALLRGEAELRVDAFHTYTVEVEPPKWARMEWDSFTRTRGPFKEERMTPALSKQPITAAILEQLPRERRDVVKRMQTAMKNLEVLFGTRKSLQTALKETLEQKDPVARVLGIYCLASIDMLGPVIDALGDEDEAHGPDREAAMFALQRWVSRGADQAKQLYDEKTGTGILLDKKYKKSEAETIVQLLHPFLADDLVKEETYYFLAQSLRSSKVAIAELGFWNLYWLCRGKIPTGFSATLPVAARTRYAEQIDMMIEKKQIPPPPEKAPAGN